MSWDTRAFEAALETVADHFETEIEREVHQAGHRAYAEMKGKVKRDSNETADSITLETGRDEDGPYAEWKAGGAAIPLEYGTSRQEAKPFFRGPIIGNARDLTG